MKTTFIQSWKERVAVFFQKTSALSPRWEVGIWIFLVIATLVPRINLMSLLPVYIWTGDSSSYAASAFRWLDTGIWEADMRRGPVYSLFIAGILKMTGDFSSVMLAQHVLGALSILMAIVTLRFIWGRTVLVPLTFCGLSYAVYGMPIYLEHLIRNESLLMFLSTLTLCSWWIALKNNKPGYSIVSGLGGGILGLVKEVFIPLPLLFIVCFLYRDWPLWKKTLKPIALFLLGFVIPSILFKWSLALDATPPEKEPQAGILLYGRVAQWTYFEGGIEPELKTLIRDQILDYRKLPKLDNNVILKRTVVPTLARRLREEGKTAADLEKLCRNLALEAIRSHPRDFIQQVFRDFVNLHDDYGSNRDQPSPKYLNEVADEMSAMKNPHPALHRDETVPVLKMRANREHFKTFYRITHWAWLFERESPVFLTSLLLPLLLIFGGRAHRGFWLGLMALWFFNLVLLSTIGKPMNRYLIPVVPIMFLVLSSSLFHGWLWLNRRIST